MTETAIADALAAIEAEEQAVVLLAVESGSRAWGFASPDSDWDVRFVYARPTRWHIALRPGRDVIERSLPGDLDLAGWDLRKTLNLLLGGNWQIREWLCSPVIYRRHEPFCAVLWLLAEIVPARASALHHYASLAKRVRHQWLADEQVRLKKYLYAVRPALVLRWLREHSFGLPPIDMATLLTQTTLRPAEADAINDLLARKAVASELGTGPRSPALDALVADELAMAEQARRRLPPPTPDGLALTIAQQIMRDFTAFADVTLGASRT